MPPKRSFFWDHGGALHATKANSADVYTKTEVDETFVAQGEIVMRHGTSEMTPNQGAPPSLVWNYGTGTIVSGDGYINISPSGPAVLGGVEYGLKSIEYCITQGSGAQVDTVFVYSESPNATLTDGTDRTANGCYVVVANLQGAQAYDVQFVLKNGGNLRFSGIQTTWAPVSALPLAPPAALDAAPAGVGIG